MSSNSKVVLSIVSAAAAGVVVGLLLAPEKGTDLRKKVGKTAGDWASHLTELFANAKGEINDVKGKATEAASETGSKFNNIKENFS
ncbi:MAG: hypothetical protein NVS1B13_01350 [Flavisolibacter sp.]